MTSAAAYVEKVCQELRDALKADLAPLEYELTMRMAEKIRQTPEFKRWMMGYTEKPVNVGIFTEGFK